MVARKNNTMLMFYVVLCIVSLVSCGKSVKKKYSEEGVLIEKVQVKNGVYDGEFTEYYNNGSEKMRCQYKNGKFHGKMMEYDSLGNIYSESYFADGYREGRKSLFYPDGAIMEEIDYKNGWMNGERISYYPNGKIAKYALCLKDEEVYFRTYDTTGQETFQNRKIVITPDSDTLHLGKFFRVKVEFFGPYEEPAKIGARLSSKPMTDENIEMYEMRDGGPYYITFLANQSGQQYLTIRLALESLFHFERVIPIYVQTK